MSTHRLAVAFALVLAFAAGSTRAQDSGTVREPQPGPGAEAVAKARKLAEEAADLAGLERMSRLEEALKLNPLCPDALFLRGSEHIGTGEFDLALDDLLRAATLDPESVEKRFVLASFLHDIIGDREAALFEFKRIKGSDGPMGNYAKGMELTSRGKHDEALEEYRTAWRDGKKLALACDKAVQIYAWSGVFGEAKRVGQEAVAELPDNATAHISLGWALLARSVRTFVFGNGRFTQEVGGEPEPARAEFEKATQLEPNNPGAHLGLGVALLRLKKETEGLAAIEKAVALSPTLAEGYVQRGWYHFLKTEEPPKPEE
ncbi:MAG: tetratricopeptide repeat protein, partial [Planctomycetota bacterium]|nr:tetratricopeptide repeat protein [Planctomycetota bacterium]